MNTESLEMDHPETLQANAQPIRRLWTMRLDAREQSPAVWAAILGGAGLGLGWGIAARLWMRLISTQPEFSIFGTAAILIIATVFGAWVGLAFAGRRRGWPGWGHYVPRSLVVMFFIPFGAFGGAPLMLTVLLATLGLTQRAVVSLWFLVGLAGLVTAATDFGLPSWAAGLVLAGAIAVTAWKWIVHRPFGHRLQSVDLWLERLVRAVLVLLAVAGFGFIARDVLSDKPGLPGWLYVFLYLVLLYPLVLALRIGLKPYEGRSS